MVLSHMNVWNFDFSAANYRLESIVFWSLTVVSIIAFLFLMFYKEDPINENY